MNKKAIRETSPNPGSKEAVEAGCTCPVMDNAGGRGRPYGGEVCWVTIGTCPLHGFKDRRAVAHENFLVQSAAAAQTKRFYERQLADFSKKISELGGTVSLSLHDEIIVELPEDKKEEAAQLLANFCEEIGKSNAN